MPSRNSLRDFIRASLHCFHPEKDEDKAYVLTVHPGSDPETYHVTAYWGARTAKRLSSQMKAINVSADAAQLEVEKAKREKLRCGYVETPFAKILTNEARSHISAALGLHEAPGKAKKPVAAKRKNATQDLVPVKPSRGTKVAAKTASAKAQAQRKPASKKTMSAAK